MIAWGCLVGATSLVDAAAPVPGTKGTTQQLAGEAQLINQLVFRSRKQQVALQRLIEDLRGGREEEGLESLQSLLDRGEDGFLWRGETPRLVSVRQETRRLLDSLSPEDLRRYESLFGIAARQLLQQARAAGEPALFAEVLRRYFHTSAGFEAANYLGTHAFDSGRYALAVRHWQALVDSPAHRGRVDAMLRTKLAAGLQLMGRGSDASRVAGELGEKNVVIAGRRENVPRWVSRLSPVELGVSRRGDWPLFLGNAARNASAEATTPFLKLQWSASTSPERLGDYSGDRESGDHELDTLLGEWKKGQLEKSRPLAVANYAIVVRDQVVYRDLEGIRAVDVHSGRRLWEYECVSSPASAALIEMESMGSPRPAMTRMQQFFRDSSGGSSATVLSGAYVGNSALGTLASDGQRVYAVDAFDFSRRGIPQSRSVLASPGTPGSGSADSGLRRDSNVLVALPLPTGKSPDVDNVAPLWTVGGSGAPSPENPLAGHFFLGPPLPVEGLLYATTEIDQQLNLVALHPANGRLAWTQGIAFVDTSIDVDVHRAVLSCAPSFADGIIVCPTQIGLLVGVDAVTGSLAWAYYYGDARDFNHRYSVGRARASYGHAGYAGAPQIRRGRVVDMPRQSRYVHCLDLATGKPIWKVERHNPKPSNDVGDGDEYLATVTDELVLVVGNQYCRALALEDGSQEWSIAMGMPSGRGIRVGNRYLLPLEEGRIATIDLATGQQVGYSIPRGQAADASFNQDGWRPGNLIAHDEMIISMGPFNVAAFPQSELLLARTTESLRQNPNSAAEILTVAELELTLGRLDQADARLERVLARALDEGQRRQAETLLRELLFLKLSSDPEVAGTSLARLDRLSHTASQRARYLMQAARWQQEQRDFAGILQSTKEFARLDHESLMPMPDDAAHFVSAASWIPAALARARDEFGPAESQSLASAVAQASADALQRGDGESLRRFLRQYDDWPEAVVVRSRLAELTFHAGKFQETELLLLRNRAGEDPEVVAGALIGLVRLWDDRRLYHEAAGLLHELRRNHLTRRLDDGGTVAQFLERFPRDSMTWLAYRNLAPVASVERVAVIGHGWDQSDRNVGKAFSRFRRRFQLPDDFEYLILDKGRETSVLLAVIDRQTGVIVGQLDLPSRNSPPGSWIKNSPLGHLLPFGDVSGMHGVSLLQLADEKPHWSRTFQPLARRNELLSVGPAGPGFCSFQGAHHLIVVDPATGKTLWRRSDLLPNSGALANAAYGLFGDDQAIVVFASDLTSYVVYRTRTGEVLRKGRLDVNPRYVSSRRVFGRKFLFVSNSAGAPRLQIWDPLSGRIELDLPFDKGTVVPETHLSKDEFAVILPEGVLQVIDVQSALTTFVWKFDPRLILQGSRASIKVFSDEQRYYVNFQQRPYERIKQAVRYSIYYPLTFIPRVEIQGHLFAVDRASAGVLWERIEAQRSVLDVRQFRLPFLIALSKVRDLSTRTAAPRTGSRDSLRVEVIDCETGRTLGLRKNILPDSFVQFAVDKANSRVQLQGLKSRVDLVYGASGLRNDARAGVSSDRSE
ncbi:MAG: hypothetical protein CMJ48_11510 [Planctomycetaceae bacterium]|nr:hypothetical protein [Planctomycetaceae bacterium]